MVEKMKNTNLLVGKTLDRLGRLERVYAGYGSLGKRDIPSHFSNFLTGIAKRKGISDEDVGLSEIQAALYDVYCLYEKFFKNEIRDLENDRALFFREFYPVMNDVIFKFREHAQSEGFEEALDTRS